MYGKGLTLFTRHELGFYEVFAYWLLGGVYLVSQVPNPLGFVRRLLLLQRVSTSILPCKCFSFCFQTDPLYNLSSTFSQVDICVLSLAILLSFLITIFLFDFDFNFNPSALTCQLVVFVCVTHLPTLCTFFALRH